MNELAPIGYVAERTPLPSDAQGALMRIVEQHRSGYVVHDGKTTRAAKALPKLRHHVSDASERPCVGDWCLVAERGCELIIERVLPRFSTLVRGAAGETQTRQALAANIDHVLIVTGLDRDFNVRRIERYLTLVSGSGVRPTLVLTKADKELAAAALRDEVAAIAPGVTLHLVNAKSADSCAALAAQLLPGETAVLVGSSGAGKSTLTNTLLGAASQATGSVREADGRGRHTTVSRALLPLPGGACLIDTPGLREIKLTGDEDVADSFDDIAALAAACRFRDCQHEREPGCAVRKALDAGELDDARFQSYQKLSAEVARAGETVLARQARKAYAAEMSRAMRDVTRRKR